MRAVADGILDVRSGSAVAAAAVEAAAAEAGTVDQREQQHRLAEQRARSCCTSAEEVTRAKRVKYRTAAAAVEEGSSGHNRSSVRLQHHLRRKMLQMIWFGSSLAKWQIRASWASAVRLCRLWGCTRRRRWLALPGTANPTRCASRLGLRPLAERGSCFASSSTWAEVRRDAVESRWQAEATEAAGWLHAPLREASPEQLALLPQTSHCPSGRSAAPRGSRTCRLVVATGLTCHPPLPHSSSPRP